MEIDGLLDESKETTTNGSRNEDEDYERDELIIRQSKQVETDLSERVAIIK